MITPHLPDDAIEMVRALGERQEKTQWALGDTICEICDELYDTWIQAGIHNPRAAIIRELANATGLDISTLRDRHIMARFFTHEDRIKYSPLTYHQLRACKSAGENWRQYAEWALANLPAPVALIRTKIKNNGDLPDPWIKYWSKICELAGRIIEDEKAPVELAEACRNILIVDMPFRDWRG
jgi:hypothetical protein